ncbi:MAG: GntR family transcriptional regulator [Paenibacillus sp.]|jgi:multiple sugar transport system substrate-binding protein|nr:GntR family transcriptional regulator [Paenibacillus sp.]
MRRESEFRYSKLANILREQILSGFIKPGEFLYSENELCRFYQISRTSVRKSLEQLQKEGLIVKKVGQGTIVAPDLVIPESQTKVLRIMAPSPSHYVDHCLPIIIHAFKSRYPNVEVKVLSFPSINFKESMQASMELGHSPDLLLVTDRQYDDLLRLASFEPLQERFKDQLDSMYPQLVEGFRREGQVKAVPATFSPVYLAYNPKLFAAYGVPKPEPDWSVDDFLYAAQKLTVDSNQDGITDQYGLLLSSSSSRWPVFALQNGYTFQSSSSKEALEKTLSFLHDIIYRKRAVTLYQGAKGINSDAFVLGKAAMVLTTTIELASWGEDSAFEPQVAPLPFGPEKASLLVANGYMIPSHCPDFDLAAQFMEIALDPEVQITLARQTGFLSSLTVNDQVWDQDELHSWNLFEKEIVNCFFLGDMFSDPMVIDEIESEMDMFWAGLESSEEFAVRMIAIVEDKS